MRRPLWQGHIVTAALCVGCGAAPPAGATETVAVSAESAEPAEAAPPEAGEPQARAEEREAGHGDGKPAARDEAGENCANGGECREANGKRPERERERRVADTKHRDQRRAGGGAKADPGSGEAAAPEQNHAHAPAPQGELVDRLFFPRGSANLDEHGHALDAIAKVVRAGPPVTVHVIGGADEREPPALARTRAHNVRDALLARGVPASWIAIALESPGPGPASYDQKVEIRLQRP